MPSRDLGFGQGGKQNQQQCLQITSCSDGCRYSEALLTKQAGALVRGVDLVAGLRNRMQMLLELHAAAGVPITQQALALFGNSLSLVKVRASGGSCLKRARGKGGNWVASGGGGWGCRGGCESLGFGKGLPIQTSGVQDPGAVGWTVAGGLCGSGDMM